MIELEGVGDYWELIGLALAAGAFGGVISALLPGAKSSDWLRNINIGGGAAVAIMLVLPPTTETVEVVNGETVTTTEYSLITLFATSLIAGSAGPRVFAALQAKQLAALAEQKSQTTAQVSKAAVDQLRDQIPALVQQSVSAEAKPVVDTALQLNQQDPAADSDQLANQVATQAVASIEEGIARQLDAAQNVMDAAAQPAAN